MGEFESGWDTEGQVVGVVLVMLDVVNDLRVDLSSERQNLIIQIRKGHIRQNLFVEILINFFVGQEIEVI